MSHPPDSMPDLTAAILARTSGPVCGRLRDLACNFVDGLLPPDDRDLVRGHLDHCPACQGLIARLEAASRILPGFTELDPGAGFTASVLSRTQATLPIPAQSQDRLVAGWARLMRRPRAALEAAYLATAAGLLFTQVPLPGSQQPAGSALAARVRTESRATLAATSSRAQTWTTRARAANPLRILPHRDSVWSTLWSRLTRRVGQAWLDLSKAVRQARARLWRPPTTANPAPTEPSGPASRSAL